ncbi:MAG: hypothetical protein RL571_130 [Pseudomonadota bacterium]|jgi:acetate kinase
MSELVLVINAGSSSIKFSLFETGAADPVLLFKGLADGIYVDPKFVAKDADDNKLVSESMPADMPKNHDSALRHMLAWLNSHIHGRHIAAIGHRVVHGGLNFCHPVRITEEVLKGLDETVPLAPLHAPHNIMPMRVLAQLLPNVPQVACFDTAFHRTQPELEQQYALPYEFSEQHGIRRYGFHGLSYEYIASVLPTIDAKAATGRTVVAHLGNGSSMAALLNCVCQATTMGFTALEGLPMGTRCGTIDPALVLHFMSHLKMDVAQIEELMYKKSGLLGMSGISSDMRDLHASKDPHAKFAVDYFAHRVVREAASLAAAMQGFDALVFTAGIGENDDIARATVCNELRWMGVELDEVENAKRSGEPRCISLPSSRIPVYIIPTNEELMIARHALKCVAA